MSSATNSRRRIIRPSRVRPPEKIAANTVSRGYFIYENQRRYFSVVEPYVVEELDPFASYIPTRKTIFVSANVPSKLRKFIALLQYLIFNKCREQGNPHISAVILVLMEATEENLRETLFDFLRKYYDRLAFRIQDLGNALREFQD